MNFKCLFWNFAEFFEVSINSEMHNKNVPQKSKSDTYLKENSNLESVHFDGAENRQVKSSKSTAEQKINDMFHSNPINFANKNFDNTNEVFVKEINIDLSTVIESYKKSIGKLKVQLNKRVKEISFNFFPLL